MKRLLLWALALALLAGSSPAGALADTPLGPYFATDNVEYIDHVPFENDTSGARIVGRYMYVTTSRGLSIYDLSDPLAPDRVGFTPIPQIPYFPQEDVDTNGRILLVGSIDGALNVIDVEDKTNPRILSRLLGGDSHTHTCILSCTYSYGAEGQVVDLRDPANPRVVGNWADAVSAPNAHDVTEVAPGFVVVSGRIMLLDARRDPADPKVIANGYGGPGGIVHSNLWPRRMRDRFLLISGEGGGPSCGKNSSSFSTWDTRGWQRTHTFQKLDEYRVRSGLYTEGNSPANTLCTHWFQHHPSFRDGGVVAAAFYEHGTRLLRVSRTGKISSIGYFLPAGGSTSAAYWVTDRIVYTADYTRGIDIIRIKGDLSPPPS